MRRRDFVKGLAAVGAATLTGCGGVDFASAVTGQAPVPTDDGDGGAPPNILFVMVDEMRYPMHFPAGVHTADQYLERFMPNLYRHLWREGVKFSNHQIAAGACTPSRSVMLTGLYTQQTWVLTTIDQSNRAGELPPSLSPEFPTYGSLLQPLGYDTPYFGKFHVSSDVPYNNEGCATAPENYLQPWGFTNYVCPDPAGSQGQGNSGDGLKVGDKEIADAAVDYLSRRRAEDGPFCATVSFVNPHDYQFFWGGTEPDKYMEMFNEASETPLVPYDTRIESEANPPAQGFPQVPENWETFAQLQANKPRCQAVYNEANQCIFGGVSFEESSTDFELRSSLLAGGAIKKAVAPYGYWQRGLDSYAQLLNNVDSYIGQVLDALPEEVRSNTVVVFTSDHGDHVGSHGFVAGKMGTVYREPLQVPLVVRDYTGRFASDPGVHRTQLTSSVDLMRMLVTLGYSGSSSWITGELAELYSGRHDLFGIVRSKAAPGRDFAFYTTDEFVNRPLNFEAAPVHISGVVTDAGKLGLYRFWRPRSTEPLSAGQQLEYYDYSTAEGRLEVDNQPGAAQAEALLQRWDAEFLPGEVRKPLPSSLQSTAAAAQQQYVEFTEAHLDVSLSELRGTIAHNLGLDGLPSGAGI